MIFAVFDPSPLTVYKLQFFYMYRRQKTEDRRYNGLPYSIERPSVIVKVKVKASHTRDRALGPELIPVYS